MSTTDHEAWIAWHLWRAWTPRHQERLDVLRRRVHLCRLHDRPQAPSVETLRELDELERRKRDAGADE